MTEPTTPNIGLIIPNTGDLSGTWGSAALNPDYIAIDGYQAGVVAVAASGAITLTSPAGFTATPSQGPTQSQNALIRLSGALTGNVTVTFPLPGYYIIENLCTNTANFYVQLISTVGGNKIGAVPGKKCHVFNDGTDMDYVNMPDPGVAYDLHGATTYPPWMLACTVRPYLIKDGAQYPTATYPALFATIGYTFGGSGANFNVPDERARMRIGFDPDNTGRVNSTVNAGTMGSVGGAQALSSVNQLPQFTPSFSAFNIFLSNATLGIPPGSPLLGTAPGNNATYPLQAFTNINVNWTFTFRPIGSMTPIQALPPAIVDCLPMIKT